ncbi:MAG: DUF192 domain-containing protein [Microgenomates group bacterium]
MKRFVVILLILILIYTRFVNLQWGLPYPMHPDERNMAVAIEQLNCDFKSPISSFKLTECFNPHFFAYGQLPLYLSYGGIQLFHLITGISTRSTFIEATSALRALSALSSLGLVAILLIMVRFIYPGRRKFGTFHLITTLLFLTLQPYAIQFAHFGTTESLLMLFYATIVYYSLRMLSQRHDDISLSMTLFLALFSGLALGTKVSSLPFLAVPLLIYVYMLFGKGKKLPHLLSAIVFMLLTFIVFVLSSPHTLLNIKDFMGSMSYESAIATGTYRAFYTRQFENTTPLLFQFKKILPYTLGLPGLIFSVCGFVFLSWKEKKYNVVRLALLLALIPSSFFYAKWSRFIAPAFPLFSLFALLFALHLLDAKKHKILNLIFYCVFLVACIPGLAYLTIYSLPDVRFSASEWIYKNIAGNKKILTETANVVDIPILPPTYQSTPPYYLMNSFNFYDVDISPELQFELSESLKQADYIIIPSRRIFMNHPPGAYPILARYYEQLFDGSSGFKKIAEFSSFPRIQFFGKTIWELNDESAEETWTVFDHPVIRIYKRVTPPTRQVIPTPDFTDYGTLEYRLQGNSYQLYVADTEDKWEKGLMYVKNKVDIDMRDGMIFTFPEVQLRTFWNNNTYSNITLYWIKDGTVMGTSQLPSITKSKTITTISSPVPVDTVIELINE